MRGSAKDTRIITYVENFVSPNWFYQETNPGPAYPANKHCLSLSENQLISYSISLSTFHVSECKLERVHAHLKPTANGHYMYRGTY